MNRLQQTISTIVIGVLLITIFTVDADSTFAAAGTDVGPVHARSVSADFDTVRFSVESAIENRGYVIDYHSRVGEMLERTAADIDAKESPYLAAENWQFCSAILSRQMVDADPANIAYCPYVIFAYETRVAPGTVIVGFRTRSDNVDSASSEILEAIDRELTAIVSEAIE